MIVTNWTMRRFHNTLFLVLLCWRATHGLPMAARVAPSAPAAVPPTEEEQGEPETIQSPQSEPPATAAPTAPTAERVQRNGEEGNYFQGDIRLLPTDDPYNLYKSVFKRAAFDQEGSGIDLDSLDPRKWPDGRIPYVFPLSLSMEYRDIFERAIYKWEEVTCVDFVRISDFNITEEAYLVLTDSAGCSSYVGRIGGPQDVSIGGCMTTGHALHELGHALGLWHEHSRWDRDMYITIDRENVIDSAYYNFGVLAEEKWSHIPDVGYDLLSIMHYGANSFSKNEGITIRVVTHIDIPDCATEQMGQRRRLSRRDKLRTSMMYNCENETRRAQNSQDKCEVDLTTASPSPSPTPSPTSPPPPPPPTDKLMNNDRLRLNINSSQHESLFCTDHRCTKNQCDYNPFSQRLTCEDGFDFTIHHYTPRRNQKIKQNDTVNLQSLHKKSRWLECSGQNICSISDCPSTSGNLNISNISECDNQRFIIISNNKVLKNGTAFKLKHESNNTYVYCTSKWCDLLPPCTADELESSSTDRDEVLCHSATEFYVEKLYL